MKASDLDYHLPSEEFNRKYGNKGTPMKPKYVLLVDNGTYAEDSLVKLIWTVLKHRLHHLYNGEGWRD
jgi:hypothetical protein